MNRKRLHPAIQVLVISSLPHCIPFKILPCQLALSESPECCISSPVVGLHIEASALAVGA